MILWWKGRAKCSVVGSTWKSSRNANRASRSNTRRFGRSMFSSMLNSQLKPPEVVGLKVKCVREDLCELMNSVAMSVCWLFCHPPAHDPCMASFDRCMLGTIRRRRKSSAKYPSQRNINDKLFKAWLCSMRNGSRYLNISALNCTPMIRFSYSSGPKVSWSSLITIPARRGSSEKDDFLVKKGRTCFISTSGTNKENFSRVLPESTRTRAFSRGKNGSRDSHGLIRETSLRFFRWTKASTPCVSCLGYWGILWAWSWPW